jgi:RNA polymerase sigma-70 factor (ECF subfamily)
VFKGIMMAVQLPPTRASEDAGDRGARHEDDASAMARIAAGDDRVFARLYEAHRRRLFRLAYGILVDANDASEAVQEAFLRLHQAAPSWEPRAAVATWLYRVVLNHCLSLRQRLVRFARPVFGAAASDAPASAASLVASPEKRAALGQAVRIVEGSLAALPLKQRAVACLFLEAELQPAEIAPLVDMTANAARVTLHRALERIRADLAAAGFDAAESPDEASLRRHHHQRDEEV